MSKYNFPTLSQRKKGLIFLIKDVEKMNFKPSLIQNYKSQLAEVEDEIKLNKIIQKERKIKLKELLK